jgi:hypothetical protein
MRRSGKIVSASLALFILASTEANGATIAEVAAKTKSLKQKEKLEYLAKGAQAEGGDGLLWDLTDRRISSSRQSF